MTGLMFPKPTPKPKKPRKFLRNGKPIRQIGKKGKEWGDARSWLKRQFRAWGITTCEIRIDHPCTRDNFLGFAHVDKRKNLGPGELYKVILACNNGHDIIEKWPAAKMREYITEVIERRNERLRKKGVRI